MSENRFYYVNTDSKTVKYYSEKVETPQGFEFAGMSALPPVSAAGLYVRNESGYDVINADEKEQLSEDTEEPTETTD